MAKPKTIQEPTANLSRWYTLFVLFSGILMMGPGLVLVFWQLDNERDQALDHVRVEITHRVNAVESYLEPFMKHVERTREVVESLLNNPLSATPVPWDKLQDSAKGTFVELIDDSGGTEPKAGLFVLGNRDGLREDPDAMLRLGIVSRVRRFLQIEYQVSPNLVTSWFHRFGDLVLLIPQVTPEAFRATYSGASVEGQISLALTANPFWQKLRADVNPHGHPFWTSPYADLLGKGLTMTYAAPVREDGVVTGIVGTDVCLDRLASLLKPPTSPGGYFFLVNSEDDKVLAAPGFGRALTATMMDLDELLPPDEQAASYLVRTRLEGTPWEILWVMNRTDLLVSALPETIVPVLLLALLAALVMTGHLLVRRRFVLPAIALVQHISAETEGESSDTPDVPPEWRRWFDALNDTYRIRAAAENQPGVVARFRWKEGRLPCLEFAGRGWEELLDVPPGTALEDLDSATIIHPDDLESVIASATEAMETREPFTVDHRMVHTSEERWLRIYASPPSEPGGTIFDAVLMDVTAEHRREEANRRLEARIQQAQKAESLEALAAGVAHDFNNILMGIIGSADLTEMELPEDSPLREYQQEISRSGHRAAELAHQMLAYARQSKLTIESVFVDALIRNLRSLFEASISKKIELSLETTPELALIEGDPIQLRQVMMNLVLNAGEAIGEDSGTITITTEVKDWRKLELQNLELAGDLRPGRYVSVLVRDTGCGMDEEIRVRIFDPFFSTKFLGRGLGLASVLGIVRGHGGDIAVSSSPDRGSTFRVLLPVQTHEMSPVASPPVPVVPPVGTEFMGVALLVDDEPVVRKVVKVMLRSLGFEVLEAKHGIECLDLLAKLDAPPAVILLDYSMPRMDGPETLRRIRDGWPSVPVVMCSGYDAQELTRDGKTDADGYLQKPVRLGTLAEAIRSVQKKN